ncbi:hypothetical protein DPMN_117885 [Dreissena polymorpha]|uniref:DNA helicase n=1 Tax=Dreissena polymorpha TaxID=45954 RepID=A0A9D4GFR6_DREPO|nr:hypothetical protein DPMN_117885 [Dreissena polymorpha]
MGIVVDIPESRQGYIDHDSQMTPIDFQVKDKQISEDENNLLYVAVTRAKNALQMSKTLMSVLKLAGEQFVYPVASDKLRESGQVFRCRGTHAEFKPHCVTLQKKEITLVNGVLLKGGLYSPACT